MADLMYNSALGQYVDIATGDIAGAPEGAAPAAPTDMLAKREVDIPVNGPMDRITGLVNQVSWNFNSALFALPDAVVRTFGRAMNLDDKEVLTLTKLFNAGQTAPRDAAERYAGAVGQGIGAGLPFTGLPLAVARLSPIVRPAMTSGNVLKNIARDTVDYVAKNPAQATAIDLAFNAGFDVLRQTVEESVSNDDPNKALYKELLPTAAFVGLPVAVNLLPSVQLGSKALNKLKSVAAGLPEVEADVLSELPRMWKLPGMSIVPKILMAKAEGKLERVFGPIANSEEAQTALKLLQESLLDPNVAAAGFRFDVAEQTMFKPLLDARMTILENLAPKELASTKARVNENITKLNTLFDSFAPADRKGLAQSFLELQQERDGMFKALLSSRKDLTDAELERLSNIYGPLDIDLINDELRGIIMSGMEMDREARKKIMSRMGLKQALDEDGTLLPTRAEGKSLFPSQDMESAATALIEKYRPDRPSARARIPEPVRFLEQFVKMQKLQRGKLEASHTTALIDQGLKDHLAETGLNLDKDFLKQIKDWMKAAVENLDLSSATKSPKKVPRGQMSARDLVATFKPDKDGFITVPTGVPGKPLRFNPQQLKEDAARLAETDTKIDINLPEGLDYLESAMRFRTGSLRNYNSALRSGRSDLTDARRILDQGEAVVKDIEKLVLDHVPRIKSEYSGLKMVVDDYRSVYEDSMALMSTAQVSRAGRKTYLVPNEELLANAFKSPDKLRQLSALFTGPTEMDSRGVELFKQGAYDWLRSKNIFTKEGLIDPQKINKVLTENKHILSALPADVSSALRQESDLADRLVTRLGILDQRKVSIENAELDKLIKTALKPDTDSAQLLEKALKSPAEMRQLVDAFKGNKDHLAALRRSVFDIASGGSAQGLSLQNFLKTNQKSLKVLFDPQHLKNLEMLADIQRRVQAFANVTGKMPEFESLDQSLKSIFGAGIQYMTTTMREAMVGRIRPGTGMLALGLRLIGTTENAIYNRIFTKALEDSTFANRILNVTTPQQGKVVAAELQNIGINVPRMMRLTTMAKQEFGNLLQGPRTEDQAPTVDRTALKMLRALPPAPKLGMEQVLNTPFQQAPAAGQGGNAGASMLYPQLFPNDPLSAMLQQRAAGQQANPQPIQ